MLKCVDVRNERFARCHHSSSLSAFVTLKNVRNNPDIRLVVNHDIRSFENNGSLSSTRIRKMESRFTDENIFIVKYVRT